MKNPKAKSVLRTAGLVLTALMLLNASVEAKNSDIRKKVVFERCVKNLIVGVSHENAGVRAASISLAGRYRIKETANSLVQQFAKEENPRTKVLIVVSLIMIGDERFSDLARTLTSEEKEEFVSGAFEEMLNGFSLAEKVAVNSH